MDVKEIEQQVRAEWKAEDEQVFAAEVQRRMEALEAERILKEKHEEREREQLLRPMEQQAICGVSSGRIVRRLPPTYPLMYVQLPLEVVAVLERAFEMPTPVALSRVVSTIVQCFVDGEAQQRQAARKKGEQGRNAQGCFIAIVEVGGYTAEMCSQLVCGWAMGYLERQAAQDALKDAG